MRCRGKPPSEWAVSWPRRSKSSTKKHKKQRGVPSQPARYSLEFFPYGSCLGQTKSPKIQFAKKVMESKRKPSDSQRNPRAGGRSAGIRTRGLLDPNQARYQTSPHPDILLKRHEGGPQPALTFWRRHPDLNWGIRILQTLALPLGYGAIHSIYIQKEVL